MAYEEAAHPRAEAGSASGGQFVAGDQGPTGKSVLGLKAQGASLPKEEGGGGGKGKKGGGKGKKPKPKAKTASKADAEKPLDLKDPRQIGGLQKTLAANGFKGADGKPLQPSGKLDPATISAIKTAQRKYGMKPDGKPTAGLLRKLVKPRMAKAQLARQKPRLAPSGPTAPTAQIPERRRFPSPPSSAPAPASRR